MNALTIILVVANVFSVFYLSSNTFAHTASISTSDNIGISVVPVGGNANLTTDNLRVISTCPLGYNVTIAGPTDNTLYLNGNSSNNTSTISASSGTAANPVSILGSNLGTWGYNLSASSSIESNFIGLTNTPSVIKTKDSASATPNGDSLFVYYGASVTTNNVSGSYTLAESSQGAEDNTISYYLTPNANCASYVIRYNDNGANSTTTMGITHTVVEDDEVMLAASNYKRAGYGFAGWSTVALNPDSASFQSDLATAKAAGKVFGPNETITADAALLAQATAENNVQYVTMYAIWVKPAANATLQGWGGCSSLNNGDVIALTDTRDNQVYAVAKLADGECWMIENLRLDANNSTDATKAQGFGGAFSGLANSETANFSNSTTSNSKYSTSNITGSNQGYRFPRYNNSNTNSTVSNMTVANANIYSYGNYYTWAAAKANTGDLTTASDSETAKTSICPAGWKLPSGTGSGDFGKLSNSLGGYKNASNVAQSMSGSTTPTGEAMSNVLRIYPNNFIYSGYISGTSLNNRSTGGNYWTSTANSNTNAYNFGFNNTEVYPGTVNNNKSVGRTIRCISANSYTITIKAGTGVSALTADGWSGSGTGTLTKEVGIGETIDLSSIIPTRKTGYTGTGYSFTGGGSISGSNYTVGTSDGEITISATGLNTPTCGISGGDTKVYNYAATTLTATSNASNFDTTSANITYSFGYNTSATGTLSGFSTAQAGNTYDVAKDAFYNTRYYGVRVTVTDKTDSSITSTCTSGSGAANRTAVYRYNSRVNFNANGGTLSGTSPVYVAYDNSATYSSRTGTTAKAIPSVTPPAGKNFAGWWTLASGGTKVINEDGTLVTSASGWVEDGKWVRTTTNSSAVAGDTLHAHFTDLYVVTISAGPGISSLTASGWTGTGTGTLTKEFEAGETIDLSTITVADKTGYTGSSYSKTSGSGTLSGSTFTVGEGVATITFKATGLNTPTCGIGGGDTKVYNYAATTLTATNVSSSYDTNSADITYSYGYNTSATGTLGNFSTAQAGNTYDVAKNAFYNVRYYGVKVTVTDKTDSSITSTCTSGSGAANRTAVTRVNSRINFNANGGTLSHSNPVYVAYDNSAIYSSRTATTAGSIPTVTAPAGKRFNGWWTAASGGTQVINRDGSLVTSAANWLDDGKWIRSSTNDTAVAADTLHAQYVNLYTITISAGNGISSLTASGWTGTGTGTLTKEFEAGETIDLSTITATNKTGYTGVAYSSAGGSISGSTYTVGSSADTITFKATGLNTPTCTISGGDTKVYDYAATTLTATSNASNFDTSSADITYSFGYSTTTTGTLGNFSTAQASNTYDVAKDAFYNVRYYGVKVTVTDKSDNSITSTCTSGTGTGTGTTVANRTTVTRVNSRINFIASSGTISGTNPIYVAYQNSAVYNTRTGTTAGTIPTVTPASGKRFNGWWTEASGGYQVIDASGNIQNSVADWTNASGQWILTDTTNTTSVNTLYAQFIDLYTITLNATSGISSLTASGWTGTGTGTLTKEFEAGETIDLSTITTANKTGYTGSTYSKTSGSGTLSGSTFTVGSGVGTITFKATGLNTPTCGISGGDTKVFNYVATTLTATNVSSSYDTSSANVTYSFGYATSTTGTLSGFSAAQAGNTYDVAKDAFRNVRYYGVRVTVTDKTDSSITSTCTSGTGTGTGGRTAVYRYNSRVNFNANGGTLSGTSPVYVAYENAATYSSRTGTTAKAIPSVTPPAGKNFAGWWTLASGGNQVIDAEGNIVAASDWTNTSGQWIRTTTNSSAVAGDTLYAHFTDLYVVTISAGPGISSLTASGWTGTGTGTLTKEFEAGQTIDLSTITVADKTGYTGSSYSKTSGSGTLSGSTFTVGEGATTITFKATGLNTPTCTIKGGRTIVYNYSSNTITATDNSSNFDTSSTDITYSFGYSSSETGTLDSFSTAQTGNTYDITKNAFLGRRYYGVKVTVTDKTDNSITSNCTSGTGTNTGENVANRTTVARVNARINLNANGGTLSGTNPIYVAYEGTTYYSGRNAATTTSLPTVTPPSGKAFNGWWTEASGGAQVIDKNGNIQSSISDWTNANGQWAITVATSDDSVNMLYAQFVNTYTITINAGAGISTLTGSGWTGSGTGTLTKEFAAGETIDLSTITATDKTGYTGSTYSKTSGSGTLSGSTFTVGEGVATITFKATSLNIPTCTISGGDTKVYNYAATTLTAGSNASNFDTSSADITYSFGYATSATGTLGNFSTALTSNTYDVAKDAFYDTRYYGVRVTVTDKTDSSITSYCTSGTGATNRTAVYRYNSRINFNANGGTLSHSNPVYVAYGDQVVTVYNSRTGTTAGSIPSVTAPAGKAFTGYWTAASGGTQVIRPDGIVINNITNWTDGSWQWLRTSTNSTAVAADTLYAQYVDIYTVTLNAGPGISSLTGSGWTGSGTGTLTGTFVAGATINLSTITAANKTGYTGSTYSKTSGSGTLSGSTFTVGSGAGTITFKATGLNTPTCTISGGDTKVYNYAATTLTAGSNASNFDTNSANITYSFGYATSTTATLGNFSTAQASNTYDVAKNAFYNTRYYGVKVTVTDKTDSSITSTCTSGTGTGTGGRTAVYRYNSRVNFNANGGTLSHSNPVYVAYENSATYSSRTATTTRAIPTVTAPAGKKFNGWWTAATNGTQVINASGNIVAASGWTNTSGQWIRTTTNSGAVAGDTLYAQYTDLYTITLTVGTGISSLTASGWTGSGTSTLTKAFDAGETIDLSAITATNITGFTGSEYSKTSGSGTLSGSTFTVGSGDATITFNAAEIVGPICEISGGDTKVFNYGDTTLTATDVSSNYDLDYVDITYSFGYSNTNTGTISNYGTPQTSNTYNVAKNEYYDVRYYDVKVTVASKDLPGTNIRLSYICSGATDRAAVYRYNSRVNFNANGGTLSGTSPVYVAYENSATYSSRTATTTRAIPSATAPSGKRFNGWWTAASGGNQVINASGEIVAAPDWTNENGQWIRTTTNSSAVAGDTLYAQYINIYTITISAGPGISSLTGSGWIGTGTGTLTKEFVVGETIDLSTITAANKTGYTGSTYSKTSGSGTLSGSTFTVGEGAATITFKATGLNTPTCTISGGDTKVYNYAATTLTAGSNASNFDTNSANITYSFGYATSTTGTLGNFSTALASNTYDVAKDAFYNYRYYGVKVTVTDKTDSSITSTCTSGTGTGTGGRTAVYRYNSRVNFNANGGTLSHSNPVYVAYENSATYSSRTATTTRAIPTVTPASGKGFNGWWTAASGGNQIIDASGNIQNSVADWTNASGQWILTNTTNSNSVNVLYAQYVDVYPCGAPYRVCYDDNGANSPTTMGNQGVDPMVEPVVELWASNFQRSGYGFAGWNTEPDGSGTMYGPNATIDDETTLDIINNDSLKLYAIWVEPAKDSSNNVLTFQTNNLLTVTLNDNSTLDSKPVGYVTALKDARDNQVYAVAKYADGNYWMIENLRLEAAGTAGSTNQALSQGYGGVFTGLANAENANFAEVTTANSKYSTSNVTGDNQAYRIPRYNNVNTQSTVSEMTDPDQNVYSYGNYYNWPAATANTTNTLHPYDSESTGTSICPAGWRLPTGGNKEKIESSGSDYYNLSYILAGAAPTGFNSDNEWLYTDDNLAGEGTNLSRALRAYPYNFVYGGRFDVGSAHDRGLVNNYWSATKHLHGSGHRFAFRDTYVFPATTENFTYRGDSVRCMAGQVLYNNVAKQSKGTQTSANLQANITKSNSGVYEYNSSVFGAATDAANDYKIYYYRGILDNTTGTYGSNGDGAAYPNYVRLGNTCWRIVRTTGSGGTKMIYNGNWTGSTCANATTNAQVGTSAFNGSDDTTSRQWVRVGYTYRSAYASTATNSRTLANTFGTDTSFANNSTSSNIKSYIEGTWFTGANGVSAYQSMLEPSAGYCNDRTVYNNATPAVIQADTLSVAQYATSATRYNFGALIRNVSTTQIPSLGCPRSTADLYTTSAASNGNKQLTRAAALLTADEASFAGSGNRIAAENGSDYDPNSFLNSGSEFLLLSPYYRATTGIANVFEINANGAMTYISTGTTTTGVRPVISLKPGTVTTIGSGTATDPWIIKAP